MVMTGSVVGGSRTLEEQIHIITVTVIIRIISQLLIIIGLVAVLSSNLLQRKQHSNFCFNLAK